MANINSLILGQKRHLDETKGPLSFSGDAYLICRYAVVAAFTWGGGSVNDRLWP